MNKFLKILEELFFPMADRCPVCAAECACGLCDNCKAEFESLELSDGVSAFSYDGKVKEIVHRYKFNGEKYLCDTICEFMMPMIKEADVITNVPVHRKRRRQRGYDQSMLIAKGLSEKSGIKYEALLKKTEHTMPQSKLTAEERAKNAKGKYAAISDNIVGKHVILVDDVITTGATINECSDMLLRAGARKVDIISFAKT